MSGIAIIVPTVRPASLAIFKAAWASLFERHNATLVVVKDGDEPTANGMTVRDIMGADSDLIYNHTDSVRNLGFAFAAQFLPSAEAIITLDDDTLPVGDTIEDHIRALSRRYPVSWMSTASEYTRGMPYDVRDEAPAMVSHGVWQGVADWDAPTQLVHGNRPVTFYQGAIPRGALFPMCGMNLAVRREALPLLYFAPMGPRVGLDRFGDIWCGVNLKRECDARGWAVVTGYAAVHHDRASNVYANLSKEARGLGLNEGYWRGEAKDPYFSEYGEKLCRWQKLMEGWI